MMKLKNTVRICVEASIKAISQHKEMFNCGISSIDVGEGAERDGKSYLCKQLLPLLLWGLSVFAQSNLIKALCPAPSPKARLHLKQTRWIGSSLASSIQNSLPSWSLIVYFFLSSESQKNTNSMIFFTLLFNSESSQYFLSSEI